MPIRACAPARPACIYQQSYALLPGRPETPRPCQTMGREWQSPDSARAMGVPDPNLPGKTRGLDQADIQLTIKVDAAVRLWLSYLPIEVIAPAVFIMAVLSAHCGHRA